MNPASSSTSSVCCPNSGAVRRMLPGVACRFTAGPTIGMTMAPVGRSLAFAPADNAPDVVRAYKALGMEDLLKVTDFALLRGLPRKPFLAIQKSRQTNIRYLAPEVRLEVPDLDKGVDLYSLGAILLEMLSGIVHDDSKP